jgi:hypothetical protein
MKRKRRRRFGKLSFRLLRVIVRYLSFFLLFFSSFFSSFFLIDSGGPAYWSLTPSFPHGAGANNWPLKGSKVSAWEGGMRVAAFVSGGFLPEAQRGTKLEEYIHMADWQVKKKTKKQKK